MVSAQCGHLRITTSGNAVANRSNLDQPGASQCYAHAPQSAADLLWGVRGFIVYDLGKHAGVDVVEVAEDVHVFWCPGVRSNEGGVVVQ